MRHLASMLSGDSWRLPRFLLLFVSSFVFVFSLPPRNRSSQSETRYRVLERTRAQRNGWALNPSTDGRVDSLGSTGSHASRDAWSFVDRSPRRHGRPRYHDDEPSSRDIPTGSGRGRRHWESEGRPVTPGVTESVAVLPRDSRGHASYIILDGGQRRYPLARHEGFHATQSTTKQPWANSECPWPDISDPCIECRCDAIRGCTRRYRWITCNVPPCVNPVVLEGQCCPTCLEGRNCYTPWPDMPVMEDSSAGVTRSGLTCKCSAIEEEVYFQRDGYDRTKHEAQCTKEEAVVLEVPVNENGTRHQGWTIEELLALLQPVQ